MNIYPAIDIRDGKVVRLTRGDYDKTEVYHDDPAAVARDFAQRGARFLHVVDLDGAKDGKLSNYETVLCIAQAADLSIEIGGGIRDAARVEKYLSLGVDRVILGTAAVNNEPFLTEMLAQYGDRIAVGVDAKNGLVATEGWRTVTQLNSVKFCKKLVSLGATRVIYTDISRDGAMQGTNLEIYRTLSAIEGLQVTASGGISTLAEIQLLRAMGTQAAILGKALYVGAIRLEDALRVADGGKA